MSFGVFGGNMTAINCSFEGGLTIDNAKADIQNTKIGGSGLKINNSNVKGKMNLISFPHVNAIEADFVDMRVVIGKNCRFFSGDFEAIRD